MRMWRLDYLSGFAEAARDIAARRPPRLSFGSFAMSAYALGYRAGIASAREAR